MGRDITLTFGTDAVIAPLPAGTVRIIVVGDLAPTTNTANISDLLLSYYDDPNTSMLVTSADNVYEQAAPSDFDNCVLTPYVLRNNAQWVYPTTGHHDWGDSGVQGLTSTIHSPADGLAVWLDGIQSGLVYGKNVWYYTHDIPAAKWRIIHLSGTTNMGSHIVTSAGNPIIPNTVGTTQNTWFGARLDEAVNLNYCVLVVWSDPFYGTTDDHHSAEFLMKPFWDLLYAKVPNQALVICGHKHNYERFFKMDNLGATDSINGIPTIIAGTGGNGHYGFTGTTATGSAIRDSTSYGVVELTLSDQSAKAKFVLTDNSSGDAFTWALTGQQVTPPTTGNIYGSSAGPAQLTTQSYLKPNMVRVYFTSQLNNVPAGTPALFSLGSNTNFAVVDNTAGSAYLTERNSLRVSFGAMEDIPNQWATLHHEPENGDPITPTQWSAMQVNFKRDVITFINSSRINKIKTTAILIGQSFNSSTAATWLTTACLAAIDAVGSDPYSSGGLNGTITWVKNLAIPKDWILGEIGDILNGNGQTDAHCLAWMKTIVPTVAAYPPQATLWFNNYYNTLVCNINSAVTPTSTHVNINTSVVPPGSSIMLEPGTVREETITVGQFTGTTGNSNIVYPITSTPKFSHSVNTPVLMRPQSAAYWQNQIQA